MEAEFRPASAYTHRPQQRGYEEILRKIARMESLLAIIIERLDNIERLLQAQQQHRQQHAQRQTQQRSQYSRGSGEHGARQHSHREPQTRHTQKTTAYQILEKEGAVYEHALRGRVRSPERLIEKLRQQGALVFDTPQGRVAVHRDYLEKMLEALNKSGAQTEEEALAVLAPGQKKLFRALREAGTLVYNGEQWVVNASTEEEA